MKLRIVRLWVNMRRSHLNIIRALMIILAVANVIFLIYRVGYAGGYDAAPSGAAVSDFDFYHWLTRLHFGITIGLVVSAVGLWLNTARGFLIAVLGLLGVGVVYARWYVQTKTYIRNSEITEYVRLHDPYFRKLMLHGGTWWDFLVLAIAFLIFCWVAVALVATWNAPNVRANT